MNAPHARPRRLSEAALIAIAAVPSLFFVLFPLLAPPSPAPKARARSVLVLASAGELGGFQPSEIKVVAGEPLHLSFWSMDVGHSFNLPQLGIDLLLSPGEAKELSLETGLEEDAAEYRYVLNGKRFPIAKTPGAPKAKAPPLVLEFKCNRYCSPAHWGMRGQLIVEPPP